jgi:hypothetical protein
MIEVKRSWGKLNCHKREESERLMVGERMWNGRERERERETLRSSVGSCRVLHIRWCKDKKLVSKQTLWDLSILNEQG